VSGTTERVSVDSSGTQGNGYSRFASVSSDGRYVVFHSVATNLVPNDGNGLVDIFVRDRTNAVTTRASAATGSANMASTLCSLSPDGRFVAFASAATNLVASDTNGAPDVFVLDRPTGTIDRASVTSGGIQGIGESLHPAITPDGRYVVFDSYASNLAPGGTSGRSDIYLRDRQAGTTEVVSLSSGGAHGNSDSFRPQVSADGRFVAFESNATNLVTGDTNGVNDVFVRDRQLGTTERVSVASGGGQGDQYSYVASISSDGRYVAFQSFADNLVAGDTNGQMDVFVRDRQAGTTVRASVSSGGVQGNSGSYTPSISANGRYVAFASDSSNLVAGDTNGVGDVFVRDLQGNTTMLASASSSGAIGNGQSLLPSLSSDGRFVTFYSDATNLVGGDGNGFRDVFLRDLRTGTIALVSVDSEGVQGNGNSGNQTADETTSPVSADGRYVAFVSLASNLVLVDTNGAADVFLRDRGDGSAFASFCLGDGTGAACPCSNSGMAGHGCENSSTTGGAILTGTGVASLSADTVHLTSSGEKPTATSVLLSGSATVNSLHYGDGLRCVGGTLKRLYTHNAVGGVVTMPQGTDPSISARSAASGDVLQFGSTRNYQIYYRDPSTTFCPSPNGSTFNISNAIAIAWGT
jgi:Tol biopolymer transport system component